MNFKASKLKLNAFEWKTKWNVKRAVSLKTLGDSQIEYHKGWELGETLKKVVGETDKVDASVAQNCNGKIIHVLVPRNIQIKKIVWKV